MARAGFVPAALALVLSAACSGSRQQSAVETPSPRSAPSPAAPLGGSAPSPPASAPAPLADPVSSVGPAPAPPVETSRPPASAGEPCGPLDCRRFDDAADAFAYVLETDPLVLGLGEAHVLAAAGTVRSSARRFSEDLLPLLQNRASHLLVEILKPNPSCEAVTRQVEKSHEPVTRAQAPANQNDYVELGHQARRLGIEPFLLSPTCDEYAAIAAAGPDAVSRTLTTIADVTTRMALGALKKNRELERTSGGPERLVLAYGGALHNDLAPESSRASFSYGPRLAAATGGRYTELDLFVRELIRDTDAWRSLPWFEHFDPERHPHSTIVMQTAPRSFVLFFPKSHATVAAP